MKLMIRLFVAVIFLTVSGSNANAQIKIGDIPIDLNAILGKGKLLQVAKGFSPVFKLGDLQINKVGILGEKLKGVQVLGDIFGSKAINDVMKLYKTYKTGLVVFKVLAAAGTTVAAVSTIKGIADEQGFNDATVKALLYPALTSVATGVATKLLTKAASYKAVDLFNGVVRKTLKDILSVKPASSTLGLGLYVQL